MSSTQARSFSARCERIPTGSSTVPHASNPVKGVFRQAEIKVLDWPGNSPDLNPTENLWSILKSRSQTIDCTTKTKLTEAIIQVWYRDPQFKKNRQILVQAMPN